MLSHIRTTSSGEGLLRKSSKKLKKAKNQCPALTSKDLKQLLT